VEALNEMYSGVLYAFITYIKKFFGPINDLADKVNVILSGQEPRQQPATLPVGQDLRQPGFHIV
jgi:hypothetical protein